MNKDDAKATWRYTQIRWAFFARCMFPWLGSADKEPNLHCRYSTFHLPILLELLNQYRKLSLWSIVSTRIFNRVRFIAQSIYSHPFKISVRVDFPLIRFLYGFVYLCMRLICMCVCAVIAYGFKKTHTHRISRVMSDWFNEWVMVYMHWVHNKGVIDV